uniref:Uncharacterized protein n=1 Tax=Oryza punctata TaxID=4537 RepID=A0A0E0M927_ORYPU
MAGAMNRRLPHALLLVLSILPHMAAVAADVGGGGFFPHRSLLQSSSCQPSGTITGTSGDCNTDNGSDCCQDGVQYTTYACSPPVTGGGGGTAALLTLNSFADGGDGGGASSCTGRFYDDGQLVVALSTGWFDGRRRCEKEVVIRAGGGNGASVTAMVVDECDSQRGCDGEHNFEPPCRNNIVDGSPAVWDALGLNKDDGEAQITWSDA